MTLEVLEGGLVTTIQDGGRPDWAHLGVPPSGACDPWSLAIANLLLGNDPGAAVLEMTLVGPTLIARTSTTLGLAGADLGGRIVGGRRLAPGRSHRIEAGETITFPGDGPDRRARAYLAVPGGLDVPVVLGSRSTCLAAGFGGFDGRPLETGDLVNGRDDAAEEGAPGSPGARVSGERVWPADPDAPVGVPHLRLIPGPATGGDALVASPWRVGREADRVGLRLDGGPLPDGIAGEAVSHGVTWGAIQVPPDGRPIVLCADHQTTGGYPVVAVVISADLPILGQLRPGVDVRFVAVTREAAIGALVEQRAALVAAVAALRESVGWDELAHSAGG
ncbi:MAG TPA: biotin-dependent carboxyltransferase family protein [Candidatus Limnocylindrales bacterium]|nr:biotin-dependent carboxyltransferase family protein [Candidatus Limnocylindrales bacterium]